MFFLTTKVSNPAPEGPMSSQVKLKIWRISGFLKILKTLAASEIEYFSTIYQKSSKSEFIVFTKH